MIACQICFKEMKGLTLHLHYKHNITPIEYCILYPGAKMFDDTCLKTKKRQAAFDRMKDVPKDESHCKALSIARLKWQEENDGWKHKPETREKIKATWVENHDEWVQGIKDAWTPERREEAAKRQSEVIAKNGYHLGHSTNSLEQHIEDIIISFGFTISRQVKSLQKIQNKYRYFDLFVIDLNLIIEIDGEYWHKKLDRIQLDIEKEEHVRNIMKQKFIRISDRDLGRSKNFSSERIEYIKSLLMLSNEDQILHCRSLIQSRLKALQVS